MAANAALDAMAATRSTVAGLPMMSVQWGAVAEVGMAADTGTEAVAARDGMAPLPLATFRQVLRCATDGDLGSGGGGSRSGLPASSSSSSRAAPSSATVAVVSADWPHSATRMIAPAAFTQHAISAIAATSPPAAATAASTTALHPPRLHLPLTAGAEAEALVRAALAEVVAGYGEASAPLLDLEDDLESSGLDSLGSAALRAELISRLGDSAAAATLPTNLTMEHPTLGALTALVAGVLGNSVGACGGKMNRKAEPPPPRLQQPPPPLAAGPPPRPETHPAHLAQSDHSAPTPPVDDSNEPGPDPPRRPLRILCLHGTATNAAVMRRQMALPGWLRALDAVSAECVFLDGPIPADHMGGADANALNAVLGNDAYPTSGAYHRWGRRAHLVLTYYLLVFFPMIYTNIV